ncbi:hypothetical protein NADFUDRAFT_81908 [Nadsonia fulvescens var. elongata DSM 6958]|uniref:RRM domain-containing protein n=1 Tax=Nadsonia fulvescens var. elongata DSM 6958 TaxID=857566 RepID=A0A1E3PPR6_9ASCO|nr:hypothetical protein NADFUDRAFT_81908 [Nadsonia fulvescens var. elongata DSM 6958]
MGANMPVQPTFDHNQGQSQFSPQMANTAQGDMNQGMNQEMSLAMNHSINQGMNYGMNSGVNQGMNQGIPMPSNQGFIEGMFDPMAMQMGFNNFGYPPFNGPGPQRGGRGGRGGPLVSRGGPIRRQNRRSEISGTRPERPDSKILIVENIPVSNLNDESVGAFFGKFGDVTSVKVQPNNYMAEVEFARPQSAQAAWSSPESVFGNRFVKVFWKKTLPSNDDRLLQNKPEEPVVDIESFALQQSEKQKAFELRQAKLRENERALQAVLQQKQALLELQIENQLQMAKLKQNGQPSADETSMTASLKEQLIALKTEAQSLGVTTEHTNGASRGGSNYVGRGGSRGGRGSSRGRGTFHPYANRGNMSRYNLDLRPKSVKLSHVTQDQEAHLRSYLMSVGEYDSIQRFSEGNDSGVVVAFKDRKTAEKLFFSSEEIPSVGKIEKAWVVNRLNDGSEK